MPQHDPLVSLRHMLEFAETVEAMGGGQSGGEIASDVGLARALERLLELIGEAANRVPIELRERHPAIPWRDMVKFRNVLVHWYDIVDYDLVAETIAHDIPALIEELRKIIEQETT